MAAPHTAPITGTSSSTQSGSVPPATPTGAPAPQAGSSADSMHVKGRSKMPWPASVWQRIDHAVQEEMKRTSVFARFLPKKPVPPKTTSVPSALFTTTTPAGGTPLLTIDEGVTIRLIEIFTEFVLTPQQVAQEEGDYKELGHSAAVTLATRATNILAGAHDLICAQGQNAISGAAPFTTNLVLTLNGNKPADTGLLDFPIGGSLPGPGPLSPAPLVIPVSPLSPPVPGVIYGSNTFEGVAQAYAQLQAAGHYGPYALVLHFIPYADTYAPFQATLTLTADRIKPLMTAGFYGTAAMPPTPIPAVPPSPTPEPAPPFFGAMLDIGGDNMDIVVGLEPTVAFQQEDDQGNFRLRVLERFALRLNDMTGIVILQFN